MGRMEFKTENKAEVAGDFPKLKLNKDERARIVCLESPVVEYVHTLRAPKIVNGIAEKETIKRKDETTYEAVKLDFIGRPLCLGDPGVIADKGLDVSNCPICAEAKVSDVVDAPQRRFAMHVVRYVTKQGSFDTANPYSVQVLVWAFTDMVFNKLVDFTTEWGPLVKHDLKLGPCSNQDFQKFEIEIAAEAEWLKGEDRKTLTKATFQENQCKDLSVFCGRKTERKWIEDDLEKIRQRWRIANGSKVSAQDRQAEQAELESGLGELLEDVGKPVASDDVVPAESFDDLTSTVVASVPVEGKPVDDFDSLLADLG